MDNITPKPVAITLDRERTLSYPAVAFFAMWRQLGINPSKPNDGNEALEKIEELDLESKHERFAVMLWAGLRADDPAIGLDQVRNMIFFRNLPYIQQRIELAMQESRAVAEADAAGPLAQTSTLPQA